MSVKINGLKKLDANFYEKIVIKDSEQGFLVNVSGNLTKLDTVHVGDKVSSRLKDISDEEKIKEIIEYYLDYNKINTINVSRSSDEILIKSLEGKTLIIQSSSPFTDNIKKSLFDKYNKDRCDYCYSSKNVKVICLDVSWESSSYEMILDEKSNKGNLCLTLKTGINGLVSSETKFLLEFILNKISECNEKIEIISVFDLDYKNGVFGEWYSLLCGNFEIYFSKRKDLLWIFELVDEYNKKINNDKLDIKKRQLKMEGF